ncbi:hypothetical protein D3C87_733700 [compost metagenome]|uniref:hypothetical protein n=1 Tax=Pedobacter ghigonis TaxID=2730403 RepID=UPI000FA4679F|nr:hypothetical protein [Pedobacter ghigonis]
MKVTVNAILETEFRQDPALARIMNNRLQRAAQELQDLHLRDLCGLRSTVHNLIIHLSYNQKYKIRYRILNDVPAAVEFMVAERSGKLGYIKHRNLLPQNQ